MPTTTATVYLHTIPYTLHLSPIMPMTSARIFGLIWQFNFKQTNKQADKQSFEQSKSGETLRNYLVSHSDWWERKRKKDSSVR